MDRDSVLVAVKDIGGGGDAVEWAAAEAAGRGCPLRIVHVTRSTLAWENYRPATGGGTDHAHQPEVIMRAVETTGQPSTKVPAAPTINMKLEVVVLPVSDVDRAKQFYLRLADWDLSTPGLREARAAGDHSQFHG